MKEFWNQRYSQKEYAYGLLPNEFLKEKLSKYDKGSILFPAEGEGRNAVFAALEGWKVDAFDSSEAARDKALTLARKNKVTINYFISDFENCVLPSNHYDVIVLIYTHSDPISRQALHKKVFDAVKGGGTIIFEAFSKQQLGKDSGGPKNTDMLFSIEELKDDFSDLKFETLEETDIKLDEGPYHQGVASVVRMVATK